MLLFAKIETISSKCVIKKHDLFLFLSFYHRNFFYSMIIICMAFSEESPKSKFNTVPFKFFKTLCCCNKLSLHTSTRNNKLILLKQRSRERERERVPSL